MGVLVFATVWTARHFGLLQAAELYVYDAYVRHRPAPAMADNPVAIVAVSEPDIQAIGRWPLSDEILAQAIELLASFGPSAIGVDIFRDISVPPGKARLEEALAKHDDVIFVYRFGTGSRAGVLAPASLQGTTQVGFNDVLVDPGGTVRRGLLFLSGDRNGDAGKSERTTGYSFALRLALKHLRAHGILPVPDAREPENLRLGPTTIAPLEAGAGVYANIDARGYQFLLDYRAGVDRFSRHSMMSFLSGAVDPREFKDKVVLIGTDALSVPDLFYTPFSSGRRVDQQIPGVVLHAHAVNQLIRLGLGQDGVVKFSIGALETAWLLLWSLAGARAGNSISSARGAVVVAVSGVAMAVAVTFVAFTYEWWIPVVPPAAAWLLSAAIVTAYRINIESSQRRMLMTLFSRHVDSHVAESIWLQREKLLRGGRPSSSELVATVVFTDIHGFTTISEKLSPGDLMEWLNEYMEAMTPIVVAHGGVILRFVGDAIMAAFGAPVARTSQVEICEDARRAVRCALAMRDRLIEHNRGLADRELPTIGMRIGIFTGSMVGGCLGNDDRLEYNLHGDSVNIAARLESYEKTSFRPDPLRQPCRILVGEPTLERLGGMFETKCVGDTALKGKGETVMIHQILDERTAL